MRLKSRIIALGSRVKIARCGEDAIIESFDGPHWRVRFRMGPDLNQLSDQEILDRWNDYVGSIELTAAGAERIGAAEADFKSPHSR